MASGTIVAPRGREHRQPHRAGPPLAQRVEVLLGRLQPGGDRVGVAQQRPARLGELHPARAAQHERRPRLSFEVAQVLADGRLRPPERPGGARDRPGTGDLPEDEQPVRVHALSITWVSAKKFKPS
ncbi:hypothetical protein GCM10020001_003720 [Nonomuraea salmonea]